MTDSPQFFSAPTEEHLHSGKESLTKLDAILFTPMKEKVALSKAFLALFNFSSTHFTPFHPTHEAFFFPALFSSANTHLNSHLNSQGSPEVWLLSGSKREAAEGLLLYHSSVPLKKCLPSHTYPVPHHTCPPLLSHLRILLGLTPTSPTRAFFVN